MLYSDNTCFAQCSFSNFASHKRKMRRIFSLCYLYHFYEQLLQSACCVNMLWHNQATRRQKVLALYFLSCPSPRSSWVDIVMLELNNLFPLIVVLIDCLNHHFDLDWYLNLDCYFDCYLNLVIIVTINLLDWSAPSFLDQLLWSDEIMFSSL